MTRTRCRSAVTCVARAARPSPAPREAPTTHAVCALAATAPRAAPHRVVLIDCAPVILRAQGGSAGPADGGVAGTLSSHAVDISTFASTLPRPPVLVGHSFGGLAVQEAISARAPSRPRLAGVALLCSVPPGGNTAMAARMLRATPWSALRVTYAFISRAYERDAALCRETFFSPELPEALVLKYMAQIASCKARLLDLRALNAVLPVPPQPPAGRAPVFVLGAAGDAIVDAEGVRETAALCGAAAPPLLLPGLGHDVMLDAGWERAAAALGGWLDTAL